MKSLSRYIAESEKTDDIAELKYELMTHEAALDPKKIRYYKKLSKSFDDLDKQVAADHLKYIEWHKSEVKRIKKILLSLGADTTSLIS